MSDEKRSRSAAQDWLGLLFFAAGAFMAFSIAMSWSESGAREDPNPTTAVVMAVIGAVGSTPSFATSVLVALLGGALYFVRRPLSPWRHLAGLAGLLVGSALILGAAWDGAGGSVGGLFTPLLDGGLGSILSALLGALVVAATVWVAWVPSPRRIPMKLGEAAPVSAALRENGATGVSSAEAAALLPLNEDSEPVVPAHPIDVRLRGGARESHRAQPISLHGSKTSVRSREAHEIGQPTALGGNAHERVGADLAAVLPAQGRTASGRSAARGAQVAAARAVAADPSVRVLDPQVRPGGEGIGTPPSWEQGVLDENDSGESAGSELEPLLTATEWESSTATKEVATETEPEFAWPADDESIPEHEPASKEPIEVVAEDEESEDTEFWEDDDSPADDDDDDDDEEEDEDEEEEDEEDEEDEDEEDEEEDEEEEDDEDEDEDEEEEEEEDLEEWGSVDRSVTRVAAEIAPALEPEKARELPRTGKQSGARRAASELTPSTRRKAPAQATSRRSRAGPSAVRTKAAAGTVERSHDDLLLDAGLLIIECGRVAVSMVQREFAMDFRAATNLLDELQERGVIGPYLGGRHRDILLSREEWIAIAPVSS